MSYETPGEILRYLNYDMNLYALITDRYGFEPKNYQTRIGELKSQGLSQAQAEEIADQEVANGEYLFWPTV